jgi:hypothetical protein
MASPSERGSQSHRSWVDEVEEAEASEGLDSLRGHLAETSSLNPFAAPFSPASSRTGCAERASLTVSDASADSEPLSPPPDGRGKQVAMPRRHRPRRRRHARASVADGGFLADARRSHPRVSPPRGHVASAVVHPARLTGPPDVDGFYQVQSRRRWRRRAPPKPVKPVPKNLVGLCFNCLAGDHVKADYIWRARCFLYKQPGHEVRECRLDRQLGGKHGRSASRHDARRRAAPC